MPKAPRVRRSPLALLALAACVPACTGAPVDPGVAGVLPFFARDASAAGAPGSDGSAAGGPGSDAAPDAPPPPDAAAAPDAPPGAPDAAGDAADAGLPDAAPAPAPMGATAGPGGVAFRLWAPHAAAAAVAGDFAGAPVAMQSAGAGLFEAYAANAMAGARYHFTLETPGGPVDRLDPYCRQLSGTECVVVDPGAYTWSTASFARPARAASVVYELHVGSFAADPASSDGSGTLSSARAGLGSLADLGVNVVELMPVHDFGSKHGWGYSPQLWLAPKPAYGASDDLRAFVDEAHHQGIAVWLDVVMNHYDGSPKAPLACFDGYCPGGARGVYFFADAPYAATPWGPRPDYARPEVASMLLASIDQFVAEYRGDGFRWDSVSNIRALDGKGSVPGGRELLVAGTDRARSLGALSVAEDLKGWDGVTRPAASGGLGFDAQWDGFGYDITRVLTAPTDDARDMGVVAAALSGSYAGDPFARLLFTEDHDTVGNGGGRLPALIDPADPSSLTARKRSMLGAVLLLTAPGVPMLFMGQEFLATEPFVSQPPPLAAPTPAGAKVRAFYRDLIRLRRNLDGGAGSLLEPGVAIVQRNDAAKVIAYRRHGPSGQDALVVVNFRDKDYVEYDVGVPDAGPWRVRLRTDHAAYGDGLTEGEAGPLTAVPAAKDGEPFALPLRLGGYSAVVLTR